MEQTPGNTVTATSPSGVIRPIKTIEETEDRPTGIRVSTHGITYQIKLLMLFMLRARKHGHTFSLGTEVADADKFDDVVFSCHKPGDGGKQYRFLQAKHRQNDTKTINADELLSTSDGDFSILKYFVSYRKIKQNEKFHGELKDFIICTNIDLDNEVLKSISKIDDGKDEIFGQKKYNTSKQYKFQKGSVLYDNLQSMFKGNHRDRLAASLARIMISKKIDPDILVLCYRGWLLDKVLQVDVVNNKRCLKFQENFSQNRCDDDEFTGNFRTVLTSSYRALKKGKQIDDIDEILQNTIISVPQTFNIDTKGSLSLEVSDDEIDDFFDKLVLAVKQPNEIELGNILVHEMSEDMNLIDGRFVVSRFLEYMLEWINEKVGRFLQPQDTEDIFQSLNQHFARLGLIGLSLAYKSKYKMHYVFKDNVNVIEIVKSFLGNEQKQILVVYHKNQLLSAIKIIQASTSTKIDEDIFCDLPTLQKLVGTVACPVDAFRSEAYNHLVIGIDSITTLNGAKDTIKALVEVLVKRPKKRMVIIISEDQQSTADNILNELLIELNFDNEKFMTIVDEENNFIDLTIESRQRLLDNSKVIFQGKETALHTLLDKNSDLIKADILSKLILNEAVYIGKSPIDQNYTAVKECFVDRLFQRRIKVNLTKLEMNKEYHIVYNSQVEASDLVSNPEIILISADRGEFRELCTRFDSRIIHWLQKRNVYSLSVSQRSYRNESIMVLPNSEECGADIQVSQHIILISNTEDDFVALREQFSDKTIHWVGHEEGEYLLQGSHNTAQVLGQHKSAKDIEVKDLVVVLPNSQVSESNLESCRVIILLSNNEEDFDKLWRQYSTVIYWIKYTDEFIWQQSQGKITKLREHVDNVQMLIKHEPKHVMAAPERVVIVAAEPGMGKSTLLTHLAANLEVDPKFGMRWVVRVDLKSYLEEFLKLMAVNKKKVIKFLYKAVFEPVKDNDGDEREICDFVTIGTNGEVSFKRNDNLIITQQNLLEVDLFTHFYNTDKVVVCFDGFDEISPKCKGVVLNLIEKFKDTKVQMIWVTTRPYNIQSELENRMGAFAYEIVPMREKEQIYIIKNLWEKKLKIKVSQETAKTFVSKIWQIMSQHIEHGFSYLSTFKSIPLNLKMIATVYENEFKEFCCSDDEDLFSSLTQTFSLYGLYDKFIKIKLGIIYSGARDLTHFYALEQHREQTVEDHGYLALLELFTESELKELLAEEKLRAMHILLKSIMQAKEKTGLIDRVIDGKPHFVHRTFAEHLAADLLACMLDPGDEKYNASANKFLYSTLTKENSQSWVLFKFMNYKLVADCDSSTLLTAVLSGGWRLIEELDDISDIRDPLDRTPLHLACCGFESDQYKLVFDRDEKDLLVQDKLFGWTPLHYAVASLRRFDVDFKKTTPKGANVRDVYGRTPIMLAIQLKSNMLYLMTTRNANLDIADEKGRTALHYAVDYSQRQYTAHLIKRGANPFKENDEGKTALQTAFLNIDKALSFVYIEECIKNNLEDDLVKYITAMMKEMDDDLKVQLLSRNYVKCIEFFLKNSLIDVNTKDSSGKTALHRAAEEQRRLKVFYSLLQYNANANLEDNFGKTPLQYVDVKHNTEEVKYLLLGGAHYDVVSTDDLPSDNVLKLVAQLFCNVKENNLNEVKSILSSCDDDNHINVIVNAKSKYFGKTLLDHAARNEYKDIMDYLLSRGAYRYSMKHENEDIDIKLFEAVIEGNIKDVEDSLKEGARVNCIDYRSGMQPLHLAAGRGHADIAELLVSKGAYVTGRAAGNSTILHIAVRSKHQNIVKYLLTTLEPDQLDSLTRNAFGMVLDVDVIYL